MALLWYLQQKVRLPDPRGLVLSSISPQAIVRANQEVQAATEEEVLVREKGKCGTCHCYTPKDCAPIGRYTYQHGMAAAARLFSRKLKKSIQATTLQSIKNAYVARIKQKRRDITMLSLQSAADQLCWP